MRRFATIPLTAAVAALLVPAVTPAQVPYVGALSRYAAHGCGRVYDPAAGGVIPDALCLDGFITVGRIAPAAADLTATDEILAYDLTVTRAAAFAPVALTFNDDGGYFSDRFVPLTFDGTHLVGAHDAGGVDLDFATPLSLAGDAHVFEFPFRPANPRAPGMYPDEVDLTLTITPTPEPAPLALTGVALAALGGLAALGAGGRRRRTGSA